MKNSILTALACLFVFNLSAQLQKGRKMIGGEIHSLNNKNSTVDTLGVKSVSRYEKNLFLGIRGGYFVSDHVMLGVALGYSTFDNKTSNFHPGTVNGNINNGYYYSGGVFGRYYQMLGKTRFAAFAQLGANYGTGKTKQQIFSGNTGAPVTADWGESTDVFMNIVFQPGFTFFITNKIAVETYFGNVGFQMNEQVQSYPNSMGYITNNSTFYSNLSFSLKDVFFGLNFYFGEVNEKETVAEKN